jgi:hypothetical protein
MVISEMLPGSVKGSCRLYRRYPIVLRQGHRVFRDAPSIMIDRVECAIR